MLLLRDIFMSEVAPIPITEKLLTCKPEKVLLINPQSPIFPENGSRFPYGLFCLTAYAADRFPEVQFQILDLQLEEPGFNVGQFLATEKPDLTMVTAVTPYEPYAQDIGQIHRTTLSDKVSWIGGYHPTVMPEETMLERNFDMVGIGESEETFGELLKLWIAGEAKNLGQVNGIGYHDALGKLIKTSPRLPKESLDLYPAAAKARKFLIEQDTQYQTYGGTKIYDTSPGSLATQRGCKFNCRFCGSRRMYPMGMRQRSMENVVDEIQFLNQEYGVQNFYFLDDTLNNNPKRVMELSNHIISRRLKIEWVGMGRTDVLDEDMYRIMRRAGCVEIAFGVESLDPEVRRAMGKGSSVENVESVTKMTQRSGIEAKWYLMVGSPSPENLKSAEITARGLEKMRPNKIRVFKTIPYPGTTYFNNPSLHVLPEYQGKWEHWWANNMPKNPYGDLTGITYTDLMSAEEIERARQMLFTAHLSYGGAV